jgi:hypothetical protein
MITYFNSVYDNFVAQQELERLKDEETILTCSYRGSLIHGRPFDPYTIIAPPTVLRSDMNMSMVVSLPPIRRPMAGDKITYQKVAKFMDDMKPYTYCCRMLCLAHATRHSSFHCLPKELMQKIMLLLANTPVVSHEHFIDIFSKQNFKSLSKRSLQPQSKINNHDDPCIII